MLQEDAELLRSSNKAAIRGNRLGQRSGPDVYLVRVHPEVLVCPASMPAQRARGMRLIHQQEAAKLLFDRDQLRQYADVAVHRKHAVADDQRAVRRRPVLDLLPQALRIVVPEALHLHPRHAARIQQTAMRQRVHDHAIRRPEQRCNHCDVCQVAGAVRNRSLRSLVLRHRALHLAVQVQRARQQAHAARPRAVLVQRFHRGALHPRMPDQPQVVIGRQHQHLMSVRRHHRARPALQRNLEGVRIYGAGQRRGLKQPARPRVQQVIFLETALRPLDKVLIEHLPR